MKQKTIVWLMIFLMIEIGLIHLFNAQHEYEEGAFWGFLFVVNFLGALVSAYGIYRQHWLGWILGFAVATGSLAGYVWSRTLGLPGLEPEAWFNPWGIISLVAEGSFLLLLSLQPWRRVETPGQALSLPIRMSKALVPGGLFLIFLFNGAVYQWNILSNDQAHTKIFALKDLSGVPVTSMSDLEQKYGMRVSLVAVSMMDSVVDLRLQIVDPEKAYPLLESHAAILVDGQKIIYAPHLHSFTRVKPGKIFFMFFPTQNHTVQPGSQVSLVYEGLRVEPVIAR